MVQFVCQHLMGAEVNQRLRGNMGEHNLESNGYRSGYRERRFDTMTGTLNLDVPKVRNQRKGIPAVQINKGRLSQIYYSPGPFQESTGRCSPYYNAIDLFIGKETI